MPFNRFEFEEKILACWSIVDQLDTVSTGVLEYEWTPDQVANATIGMKEIYNQRFDELFAMFERGIREKSIG